MRTAGLMSEGDVHLVHAVLKTLQVIAGHMLDVPDLDQALARAVRKMRKRRRLAGAEIAEDEAQIFAGRIGAQLHLAGIARFLGRLIDALAAAVEFPAVIDATDAVLFDPAEMQRRAAMRTMVIDDLRLAGMAAIERKILAHDANGLGVACGQILAAIERVPELPHENTPGRAGARGGDVDLGNFRHYGLCAQRRPAFDQRHGFVLPGASSENNYSTPLLLLEPRRLDDRP